MIINLSPQRRDDTLEVTRTGDILSINGTNYDFTQLPEGATLPADAVDCPYVIGDINRTNGELELTLLLPIGPNAPYESRFPEPITAVEDGPVTLPPYTTPVEPDEVTE